METIYGDNKYHNYALYERIDKNADYRLHIVRRPDDAQGFVRLPQRWVVERTLVWLGRSRRLSKNYEIRLLGRSHIGNCKHWRLDALLEQPLSSTFALSARGLML